MSYVELLVPVVAGVLRSVSGWLENALEDGKVSAYEWKLLGSSILRIVVLSVAIFLGIGVDPVGASALGVGADYLISAVKNKK